MHTLINRYFAGIGSRETPTTIIPYINKITSYAETNKIYVRSGAAPGADSMFESAVKDKSTCQIFLPWKGFNKNQSVLYDNTVELTAQADEIAKKFHPDYDRLSDAGKLLMRRNSYQVLGWNLKSPSMFIACWTQDGLPKGGTSQAMRIAKAYGINIFNLGRNTEDVVRQCLDFIDNCW